MERQQEINEIIIPEYCGEILHGDFSGELKKKVRECITVFQAFEKTGVPSILYIAAWKDEEKTIWYEYVSNRFLGIMQCKRNEVAAVFRKSIVDLREYKYPGLDGGVYKETLHQQDMNSAREELRAKTQKTGINEAVYKIALPKGRIMWVKDQARVEKYRLDRTSISLGCLTIVTKEMVLQEKCENLVAGFKNAMDEAKNP
ncbi:hypothetical protein ACFL0M_03270 [Thermodesulfobacteriota bacterium]